MPTNESYKIRTKRNNLFLRITKGHFATSHSHTNYYIDVTTQKSRLSEAKAVAEELLTYYHHNTIIDTILCLDGTQVIGTCLAEGLTKDDFSNMNAHQTIYVATPEHTTGSQLIFRDNTASMIRGKHVLILEASISTGYTAQVDSFGGFPVYSVFNPNDLPDYQSFPAHECPQCRADKKLDALVNGFGYSKI